MSINTGDKLKIWFADMWLHFEFDNNYFYHLLNTEYEVELNEEEPDILFVSTDPVGWQERKKYAHLTSAKRVFYTMESCAPNLTEATYPPRVKIETIRRTFDKYTMDKKIIEYQSAGAGYRDYYYDKCDFYLGYSPNGSINQQFPYWAYNMDWLNKESYESPDFLWKASDLETNEYKTTSKTKFCSMFFNFGLKNRYEIYDKLNSYKTTDGYGEPFCNSFYPWEKGKLGYSKDYKFQVCFENDVIDHYHSEKIPLAKYAGNIPIYWGASTVSQYFNPDCYLNLIDFDSIDALVERIKEIDQNDSLYQQYASAPLFTEAQNPSNLYSPEIILSFFKNKVLA